MDFGGEQMSKSRGALYDPVDRASARAEVKKRLEFDLPDSPPPNPFPNRKKARQATKRNIRAREREIEAWRIGALEALRKLQPTREEDQAIGTPQAISEIIDAVADFLEIGAFEADAQRVHETVKKAASALRAQASKLRNLPYLDGQLDNALASLEVAAAQVDQLAASVRQSFDDEPPETPLARTTTQALGYLAKQISDALRKADLPATDYDVGLILVALDLVRPRDGDSEGVHLDALVNNVNRWINSVRAAAGSHNKRR